MKFEEVLPALREGKKVKRKVWSGSSVVWKDHKLTWAGASIERALVGPFGENILPTLLKEIVEDNDWEIVVAVRDFKVGDQVSSTIPPPMVLLGHDGQSWYGGSRMVSYSR